MVSKKKKGIIFKFFFFLIIITVTWNPKNNYNFDAGGNVGFAFNILLLASAETKFMIKNSKGERTDMSNYAVRIHKGDNTWKQVGDRVRVIEEPNSGYD
jgi:hypothetical protein